METIQNFFSGLDIWQIMSAFVFMIAIIDPFGNIPITINMEKRGIKFVCKDSVAAKTCPERPKPDAPLIPCPGVGATTAWDALTNVCNSVGCKFVVSQGKVELGE